MIILGLDVSTHTGYAVLNDDERIISGTAHTADLIRTLVPEEFPIEEYRFIREAVELGRWVLGMVSKYEPDFIYIEQTNRSKNRTTQKQLEFLHFGILESLSHVKHRIRYIDTSAWRKILGMNFDKTQKEHNKRVKHKLARGQVTKKHLAVFWASKKFNLKLLKKDNDQAEALAQGYAGFLIESARQKQSVSGQKLNDVLGIPK